MVHSPKNDDIIRHLYAIALTKEMFNHIQGYYLINHQIMMIQLKTKKEPFIFFFKYMFQTLLTMLIKCRNLIPCQEKVN